MKNFIYESPTKIIFGKNQVQQLKNELSRLNVSNVLLVYGMGSIKKYGIYDAVISVLNDADVTVFEEANVRANPEVTSVRSGIDTCHKEAIDFILAVGGGSVIDCAKAIGMGVKYDKDVWDLYTNKGSVSKTVPTGNIITLAATGSETNENSVLSNDETNEKLACINPVSKPVFTIIDPSYTLTVNKHHTVAGSIDIIMHIFEQYFSNTKHTLTSDYLSIAVIKSVIKNTYKILNGTDNYDVRSNLSWASTIALNKILGQDKIGDWATHRLSYVLTKEHNITHGYALVLLFISWAKTALKYNKETMSKKLMLLGEELFEIEEPSEVINQIEHLFQSWGAKTKLCDMLDKQDIKPAEYYVDKALKLGPVGTVITIDREKALEIFEDSCKLS
ncbi:MAG: iron-containing alcohol dehydrogenase [Candidatus Izimaplasma sp.]|nr:iron-containing alcohol dehydrogenase [Candidatus Izimaplasma bacterium]